MESSSIRIGNSKHEGRGHHKRQHLPLSAITRELIALGGEPTGTLEGDTQALNLLKEKKRIQSQNAVKGTIDRFDRLA